MTDDADTGDGLAILTPEGAAFLAAQSTVTTPTTYEPLYPTCRTDGCQGDPEPRSQDC